MAAMNNPQDKQPSAKVPFAVVEAYKTIRTNLMFLLSGNPGCKVITVSSPAANEGKSTTSINIAIAFSQLGKRVLLVDADMRCPSIFKKLRINNSTGLSSVLAGFCSLEEAITTVNSSFDVICSGSTPPNPSEILASAAMDQLLASLRLAYDYIIIDTPPLGIVADSLVLAPKTDGIMVVVKEKITIHDEFQKILDSIKLANVRMLGVVLNASDSKSSKYHYSYANKD